MWAAQDNFLLQIFANLQQTILQKEYSLTSSLLFKKQLAKKK
jgi:hypothetical protein